LPQFGEAGSGTEFPRFGALVLGDGNGLFEAGFGFSGIVRRPLEQELSFEAVEFGFPPALLSIVHVRQRFSQHGQTLCGLPRMPIHFSQ
jgi:hypothetical protein